MHLIYDSEISLRAHRTNLFKKSPSSTEASVMWNHPYRKTKFYKDRTAGMREMAAVSLP